MEKDLESELEISNQYYATLDGKHFSDILSDILTEYDDLGIRYYGNLFARIFEYSGQAGQNFTKACVEHYKVRK